MDTSALATDATKAAITNGVNWYLSDKMGDATASIATKKYMTSDNLLVYLTVTTIPEPSIARIKIQVLNRVPGGVHEVVYKLFADNRLEKETNDMIFGSDAAKAAAQTEGSVAVSETEAQNLYQLLSSLQTARQTL